MISKKKLFTLKVMSSILKLKVVCFYATSEKFYQSAQRRVQEECNFNIDGFKNLKTFFEFHFATESKEIRRHIPYILAFKTLFRIVAALLRIFYCY
jgi:hypothetical protein